MASEDALERKLYTASKIIDKTLKYHAYLNDIPAVSFGLVYRDKLLFANGYGSLKRSKKMTINERTSYRIASISKTFTAVGILQLVEQGKLRLDDRVSAYLPWFASINDTNVEKVTIRQLLTHTSGIARDGDTDHWVSGAFPDLPHIKKYISTLRLIYEPNEKWKYSNLGYAILGEVIQSVSQVPYDEYIQVNIFDRLGMRDSSTDFDPNTENLVKGYGRRVPNETRGIFPGIKAEAMRPATGFSSNVADLSKFLTCLWRGNASLLTEASKRELERIEWLREDSEVNQSIGFQMWRMDHHTIYSHTGVFQGYKSGIAFDPEREIGVIFLTNVIDLLPLFYIKSFFHTIQYLSHFDRLDDASSPANDLSRYEGTFMNIWGPTESVAVNKKIILYSPSAMKPLEDCTTLTHVSGHVFIKKKGNSFGSVGEDVRFEFDKQGNLKRLYEGATPSEIFTY